jgi:hypothetical protein
MPRFFKLQLFWLAVSVITPAVCMALRLTDTVDPLLLSDIALPASLACWILALLTPVLSGDGAGHESRMTAFILAWSAIAIFFPLSWDLPWAIFHDWVSGATAQDAAKWYFWAYANADTRFLRSDHTMIIVEYGSGVIGFIEILFFSLFWRNKLNQAIRVFIAAGSFQFYGCTVFFLSQAFHDFSSIRPGLVSYVKFFGLNGMWMIVPALAGLTLTRLARNHDFDANGTIRSLFSGTRAASPATQNQPAHSTQDIG